MRHKIIASGKLSNGIFYEIWEDTLITRYSPYKEEFSDLICTIEDDDYIVNERHDLRSVLESYGAQRYEIEDIINKVF